MIQRVIHGNQELYPCFGGEFLPLCGLPVSVRRARVALLRAWRVSRVISFKIAYSNSNRSNRASY
jgi:hypothetical protein